MNNLVISKDTLSLALNFYNITNENYISKCYECLESINANQSYINKFNKLHKILYLDGLDRIELKKICLKEDCYNLFWKDYHPFVTNLLLLSGYNHHIENINKYKLDDLQKSTHIKRVQQSLTNDIYIKNYPGIRLTQLLWGTSFINMMIIETGILQFELSLHNPANEALAEKCIKIHIPSGNKLYISDVKKSIEDSKLLIAKYWKIEKIDYYCLSWLLSKEIHDILPYNSNIYSFYELFDITSLKDDAIKDLLKFVFGTTSSHDYLTLPESTSLQRNIKKLLLSNVPITLSLGKLKQ